MKYKIAAAIIVIMVGIWVLMNNMREIASNKKMQEAVEMAK